ncbi:molybdenum cofactor guanylyltransferase MobA [Hydrogenobacter thermophilus]|uniref:molybdenum cofactor guanylyltransferase MobA n=1 Tax=Hydrogenobacter thermophilus TaxID=940 RepID=UPI0030F931BE
MNECFILAGGQSRRFGEDKVLFQIKGKRCIEHVLDALAPVCDRLAVVGKDSNKLFSLRDIEFIYDLIPQQGALVGIYTALKNTKTDRALIVSVDMPLIKSSVAKYIIDHFKEPITIYCIRDKIYPLFGVYKNTVYEELESYLRNGKKKVMEFLERVGYHCIREDEILKLDPDLSSFVNMNTKKDLEIILKLMGRTKLKVSGMTCEHCANTVKKALFALEGVSEVNVDLQKGEVEVVTQKDVPFESFKSAIEEWGYKVLGEV